MKKLTDQLANYAAYHRDRRNVMTHIVGVPMIFVAIVVLLSRPAVEIAGLALTPAVGVGLGVLAYYLALDLGIGCIMAVAIGLSIAFGNWAAGQTSAVWLAIGVGGFAVGWVIQFVGHAFEGRKPAFVDDIVGLLIGPLFVLVEVLAKLGLRPDLHAAMQAGAFTEHPGRLR